MNRFGRLCFRAAPASIAGTVLLAVSTALSAPSATLRVTPHTVSILGSATIVGSNLQPNQFYSLIVAVPSIAGAKDRGFVQQLLRTDRQGRGQVRVRMPLLTHCGHASVYAYTAKSKALTVAGFTLTGCTAPRSGTAPPPPPGPRKHKP